MEQESTVFISKLAVTRKRLKFKKNKKYYKFKIDAEKSLIGHVHHTTEFPRWRCYL